MPFVSSKSQEADNPVNKFADNSPCCNKSPPLNNSFLSSSDNTLPFQMLTPETLPFNKPLIGLIAPMVKSDIPSNTPNECGSIKALLSLS